MFVKNFGFMTGEVGGAVVTENLDQWLDVVGADGVESAALTDSSGNGRNATNVGSVSWDETNSWWYFSGNTDWNKYINTEYRLSNFGSGTSWTIECWANITTVNDDTGYAGLVHNRSSTFSNNFVEFAVGGANEADFNFNMIDSSGNEGTAANSSQEYPSEWVMLTAVKDGNDAILYINGDGGYQGNFSNILTVNRSVDLRYGGGFLNSNRYLKDAKLGSYRFYSAALPQADARQNFNAEKVHFGL